MDCLVPTVKHGGKGVMVWGCFSGAGLGLLVCIDGNVNTVTYLEILAENLLPFVERLGGVRRVAFQQDNTPPACVQGGSEVDGGAKIESYAMASIFS